MHILIITLLYMPDSGPSAPLFQMLSKELVERGNQVTVIAAVPHYPSGAVQEGFQHGWLQTTLEDEVKVVRVRVPSINRKHLWGRAFQFMLYQIGAALASFFQSYDVVLVTNPAIEVALPFFTSVILRRKPSIFFVADVYPDIGVQLNIFRNRYITNLVEILERFCLHNATYTWIFSNSFREPIERLGISREKQRLIYSWVDPKHIIPLPRQNSFSHEYGLDNLFVVLYAGNIGLSQGLEKVLHVAVQLKDYTDICFVFVGSGSALESLVGLAQRLNLSNVKFIPFQPFERVSEVLATADIALLSLQDNISTSSIPSKIFSYLASGRPIIGILDIQSDAAKLIHRAGGGITIAPNTVDSNLRQIVIDWRNLPEKRLEMGLSGRQYIIDHHTPSHAALQVEQLLEDARTQYGK